jgi:hypothetical protein
MVTVQNQMKMPKYSQKQIVCFSGGMGAVKSCFSDSGTWMYAVEMPLDSNPAIGRIGEETTILLLETEIQKAMN